LVGPCKHLLSVANIYGYQIPLHLKLAKSGRALGTWRMRPLDPVKETIRQLKECMFLLSGCPLVQLTFGGKRWQGVGVDGDLRFILREHNIFDGSVLDVVREKSPPTCACCGHDSDVDDEGDITLKLQDTSLDAYLPRPNGPNICFRGVETSGTSNTILMSTSGFCNVVHKNRCEICELAITSSNWIYIQEATLAIKCCCVASQNNPGSIETWFVVACKGLIK
jgi:hypothetical protein